jgi:uncharacterized protein (TIRG00374 family)
MSSADLVRTKSSIIFGLKAIVSIGLIWYLFQKQLPNIGEIARALMSAAPGFIGLAFSLHIAGYLLCSWRWQLLLRAQGAQVPLRPLAISYLVGIFFNSFLPGIMSGDAIRGIDASPRLDGLSTSFLVIFVERLTGMIALLLLAGASLPFVGWETVGRTNIVWILAVTAGLITFAAMVLFNLQVRKITDFFLKFPLVGRLKKFSEKIYKASEVFRRKKQAILGCTLISILFQINVILHYYLVGRALGLPVPWCCYFAIIPISLLILMIPASINGIGLREQVFIYLFGNFGVSPAEAVSLAWISFVMVLIQAVIGGIVFALRRR